MLLKYNLHFLDSFQRCEQIPTGLLESLKDEYKWTEKAKEGEICEAEGSLTQRDLNCLAVAYSFVIKTFSYCVCHIYSTLIYRVRKGNAFYATFCID